jgi:hypothetical protein
VSVGGESAVMVDWACGPLRMALESGGVEFVFGLSPVSKIAKRYLHF